MITLRRKQEILSIFKEKNRLESSDFYVTFRKNQLNKPRFLFVASKKVFKKAVERNRVKRLLRQAVRSVLDDYHNLGYDISLIAKKSLLHRKVYDIIPQIKNVFTTLQESCLAEQPSS